MNIIVEIKNNYSDSIETLITETKTGLKDDIITIDNTLTIEKYDYLNLKESMLEVLNDFCDLETELEEKHEEYRNLQEILSISLSPEFSKYTDRSQIVDDLNALNFEIMILEEEHEILHREYKELHNLFFNGSREI